MPIKKARLRISDYNSRRKSNLKKQERRIRVVALSLTSLVDMFAILVIFLLSNSSTVSQWIEIGHGIQLPKAKISEPPPRAAAIQISPTGISLDKVAIMSIEQARISGPSIPALKASLSKLPKKDGYINIVAHRDIQFGVIKKVIESCQETGYGNLNLIVEPKS